MSSSTQNSNSLEATVSSFLSFPDSPSHSFDQVLHDLLSSADESVRDELIDRTLKRVSLLLESTKQCFRKRATLHNSISWLLPPDLTIKVFSMLDTKSVVQASACCTMFNKYAMDPSCYTHIDLTTAYKHVDDRAVSTMIHRVGNKLRSLKLGCATDKSYASLLTSSCLAPLVFSDKELTWNLLRSLHIYHLGVMDINLLCLAVSACPNLTDLKIAGLNDSLDRVLELLPQKCRLIEHLFLQNSSKGFIKDSIIEALVTNCPNLTSLTLIYFKLNDAMAKILVKGFCKLKYIDLSSTSEINGSFLRDLGHSCNDSPLETLMLRDCYSLEKGNVSEFLQSLIEGSLRLIRYIDVSSNKGLAIPGGRTYIRFLQESLKENRPEVTFVADFSSILPSTDLYRLGCWLNESDSDSDSDSEDGYCGCGFILGDDD